MKFPIEKSEAEWKAQLSANDYKIIRGKGTESAHTGELDKSFPTTGHFACKACNNPLYSYVAKFNSGCGWPAFDMCYEGSIITERDSTHGMTRVEIMCANCGGHLGHAFNDGKTKRSSERHCVNSASIKYEDSPPPKKNMKEVVVL